MKDFSLSTALRYIFPSLVAYSYLYMCDATLAKQIFDTLGILGTISLVFLGSVIYLLYRPIFDTFIQRLQDKFRHNSDNYRTYLKKRYSHYNISSREAQLLYMMIRDKYLKDNYSQMMRETASGIHLLYLAGIIAVPFFIWQLMGSHFAVPLFFLLITLIICFVGGFFLHKS